MRWQAASAPTATTQARPVARRSMIIAGDAWPRTSALAPYDAGTAIASAYEANVWVYGCVRAITDAICGLQFVTGPRRHDYSVLRPSSPLARLLGPPPGSPNPALSARRLWAHSIASYIVTGQFGWEVQADSHGTPVALWPLPSSAIKPLPGTASYFDGLEVRDGGRVRRLRTGQYVYVWRPSLGDVRKPESALSAARLDVDVSLMQDRYDYAFLKNDSRPASIVVHEAFAEVDERDAFRSQFVATFGGVSNAGKPVFVEAEGGDGVAGALDVRTVGISQRDSEAIARSRAKALAICAALGVPFSRLDSSQRTFENASVEDQTFWEARLLPLVAELEDEVNAQLAPRLGAEVGWFDLREVRVLRQSRRLDRENLPQLIQAGIITVDEARDALGLGDATATGRTIRAVS